MPKPTRPLRIKSADRAKAPFMWNISALNLSRLFTTLIDPDKRLTQAEKRLAEYTMDAVSE